MSSATSVKGSLPFSVMFAVVVLPLTYYPILRLADDPQAMGRHVNSPVVRILGWAYLGLITLVAEDLTYPAPPGAVGDSYIFYIGFDPQALKPERPPPRAPKKTAAPAQ